MTRQAVVGLFTIVAIVALFAVFLVLVNFGAGGRYQIGVHFKSAAGLHRGSLVYESGVVVGTVQSTRILPEDFSVEVVLGIDNAVDIPRDARFLIQAPLTGDSTVEIVPQRASAQAPSYGQQTPAPTAIAVLPHEVLPLPQQPQGENPVTVQELLSAGQGQIQRLDKLLADIQRREPKLLDTLQTALTNANEITQQTKATLAQVSSRFDTITATLQTALQQGGGSLTDATAQLDQTVRENRGKVNSMLASLDNSARSLNATADSVRSIAGDPRVHDNLIRTTQGVADTATTVATIARDLHNVTGDQQTQAQLRDTIANADAAVQKANSLLGQFGGKSSVYGVDTGATPAPAPSPVGSARPGAPRSAAPPATGTPAPTSVQANVKAKLGALTSNLVTFQIRMSELSTQNTGTDNSPILGRDRGPQTDMNLVVLPRGSTSLFVGANDIGSAHTTWNFLPQIAYGNHWKVGVGALYSRLGMRGLYSPTANRGLGFDGRLYDPRHITADGYLDFGLGTNLLLFAGERDILHTGRRTAAGFEYRF